MDINDFLRELASKSAVPGGGGASALAGAVGAALAGMVCSLTSGKKKYAAYQGEIDALSAKADKLRLEMLDLVNKDAQAFAPLAEAYSLPKDFPERDRIMESALRTAAEAPMELLSLCCRSAELFEGLERVGSKLAISDVGTGIAMIQAGINGAVMNVRANTFLMKDREYAEKLNADAEKMRDKYCMLAENIYKKVWERLG